MKKTIIWLLAMTGLLLATSCLKEEVLSQSTGDEVVVSFTTELRQTLKTKAIGDDTKSIDQLQVAVYQVIDQNVVHLESLDKTLYTNDFAFDEASKKTTATVNLVLAKGQTYRFAFWATNSAYTAYNFDPESQTVTVDYDNLYANDVTADAFFASTDEINVTGSFTQAVNMKRPFAQVNFLTSATDLDAAKLAGFTPINSSVKVTGVASTLNLLTGEAGTPIETEVAFKNNGVYKVDGEFVGTGIGTTDPKPVYYYLASAYFLPTDDADPTTISATMIVENSEPIVAEGITARRNYRTNIYGDLLTSNGVFNVTVTPDFETTPDYTTQFMRPIYDDVDGDGEDEVVEGVGILGEEVNEKGELVPSVYGVTNANGLKWISENVRATPTTKAEGEDSKKTHEVNGNTIKLLCNIDLSEANWDPIGDNREDVAFTGTFDGGGHKISGAHITGDHCFNGAVYGSKEGWGLFSVVDGATIKNLVVDGATFGSYTVITGTIAGYANNTTFEDIIIKNAKIAGYNWYTGGVVGWAAGKCTFKNVTIENSVSVGTLWDSHGQNAGGIAGGVSSTAEITIEDCNVACVMDVINDVTSNYKWCVYRVSGMLIGNTNTTETKYNEVVTATATNVTCKNVTVTYGEWMNYHYCEGFWNRGWGRYESSDYVGGTKDSEPHNHAEGEGHVVECFPFDQLFGGSSNGSGHYPVKGLAEFPGVTVVYPDAYTCEVCGEKHNVVKE